ncbi:MAG: peptidoglycan-associated lipoprotein Pal [Rhodobacteraceae bacterium]|nr:peptidoglycan-associated lipoprotein Pal [Paracoccaceae bacterium]
MNILSKFLTIGALLVVSACTGSNGFGNNGQGGSGGEISDGSASDPTSIAFFQQSVGDRVVFVVDQSSLTDVARSILGAQAEWMTRNPDYNAIIEGHADEQGTREYNLALGARRANAAREYLVSRGVAGSRLKVVSFGKERPIEICSEESCYAKNRRAVTLLSSDLTG